MGSSDHDVAALDTALFLNLGTTDLHHFTGDENKINTYDGYFFAAIIENSGPNFTLVMEFSMVAFPITTRLFHAYIRRDVFFAKGRPKDGRNTFRRHGPKKGRLQAKDNGG